MLITDNTHRIAIIGLGLIGGSLAQALRAAAADHNYNPHITAFDTNNSALTYAKEHGIIDSTASSPEEAVTTADIVITCVPPGKIAGVFSKIAEHLKAGSIVSDVCSVKQSPLQAAKQYLPGNVTFIPAHPIAGRAENGIEHASADLFQGAKIILTPENAAVTDRNKIVAISHMWQVAGATTHHMEASAHDRVYAYVSHLPQVISLAMTQAMPQLITKWRQSDDKNLREFVRLTISDRKLWADIFSNNRYCVVEALNKYMGMIDKFVAANTSTMQAPPPDDGEGTAIAQNIAALLKETVKSMDGQIAGAENLEDFAGSGYASLIAPIATATAAATESPPHPPAAGNGSAQQLLLRLKDSIAAEIAVITGNGTNRDGSTP